MKKKHSDLNRIRRAIADCLDSLTLMNTFLPYESIRNPTWDELRDYATEAYATGLEDVLSAMDGDFDGLDEAGGPDGRLLVRHSDQDLYIEELKEIREQLKEELRKVRDEE